MRREVASRRPLEGKFSDYVLESDGLLRLSGRIYVPLLVELRTLFLSDAHCAPYSAHLGVKKMHANLRHLFYWSGMKRDITDFVVCIDSSLEGIGVVLMQNGWVIAYE